MKEKLTLSIDKETKKRAKRYAEAEGKSISEIVEDLLNSIYTAADSLPNEKEIYRAQQMAEAGVEDWADNLE
jgi:antitoxin component of RelBE/YafQ-DinJ toxin-antitoxin module